MKNILLSLFELIISPVVLLVLGVVLVTAHLMEKARGGYND